MRAVLVVLLAFVGLAAAAINPAAGPVDVQQQLKGHAYAKGGDGLKISCKALADAFPKGSEEEIKAQLDGPFDPAYEIGAIRISMALSANGVEIPSIPKSPGHVGTIALKSKKNVLPTMEMLTTFLKKTYGRPTYDIIGNVPVSKLASFPGIIRFKVSNKEAAAASPAAASPSAPPPPQVKGAPQPGDHNCEVCMFSLGQTEFGAKPDAAICGKTKALGDKAEASCKDILDQMHSKAGFFTQMREGGCEVRGTLVKPCPEPEICSKVKSAQGTPFCPGATHKNALDIFDGKAGKLLGDKTDQVVQASRKVSVWTCQA